MRTSVSHPLQIAAVQPFEGAGRISILRLCFSHIAKALINLSQ